MKFVNESKQVFFWFSMFHKLVTCTTTTHHQERRPHQHTSTLLYTMTRVTWSAAVAVTMMVLVMSSSGVQGQSIQSQFDQASCGQKQTMNAPRSNPDQTVPHRSGQPMSKTWFKMSNLWPTNCGAGCAPTVLSQRRPLSSITTPWTMICLASGGISSQPRSSLSFSSGVLAGGR